jgi:hypothetical protein
MVILPRPKSLEFGRISYGDLTLRKSILIEQKRKEVRKKGRSNFEVKMAEVCKRVVRGIRGNPPGLICWLKGGVNLTQANEIKNLLEKQVSR